MAFSFSVFYTRLSSTWRCSSTHHISATMCTARGKSSRQSSKSNLCSTNAGSLNKTYIPIKEAEVSASNKFIKEDSATNAVSLKKPYISRKKAEVSASNKFIKEDSATNAGSLKKPCIPIKKAEVSASNKFIKEDSVSEFIALFENLIKSRNQTIQEAEEKEGYDPFSIEWKKWAESFYVMKGENTPASLFPLSALPGLLKNIKIVSSDKPYRRDFMLYKDIPPANAIMDYRDKYSFRQGGEYRDIVCPTVKLSLTDPLPEGYTSVLPLPEGYHIVLDSSSLRIISHVSREELFRSWKLDFLEQERQINMLCRRNGQKRMEALMKKSGKEPK